MNIFGPSCGNGLVVLDLSTLVPVVPAEDAVLEIGRTNKRYKKGNFQELACDILGTAPIGQYVKAPVAGIAGQFAVFDGATTVHPSSLGDLSIVTAPVAGTIGDVAVFNGASSVRSWSLADLSVVTTNTAGVAGNLAVFVSPTQLSSVAPTLPFVGLNCAASVPQLFQYTADPVAIVLPVTQMVPPVGFTYDALTGAMTYTDFLPRTVVFRVTGTAIQTSAQGFELNILLGLNGVYAYDDTTGAANLQFGAIDTHTPFSFTHTRHLTQGDIVQLCAGAGAGGDVTARFRLVSIVGEARR